MSEHEWKLIAGWSGFGGKSKDTILMCARCGTVKHEYEPPSANYPRYFSARSGTIASIGGGLGDSIEEPECIPFLEQRLMQPESEASIFKALDVRRYLHRGG